jgi:hypothetical protein
MADCNGAAISTEYYVTAEPLTVNTTGTKAYASNQAHTIWVDSTGVPPAEPFAAAGKVTPIQ